ncbi:MAG: DUF4058 family protein [Caldilineaceae bacterium]
MIASPFPGMDPYLESPDIWSDLHGTLIPLLRNQLNTQIVPKYLAELNTQIVIERMEENERRLGGAIPDVAVTYDTKSSPGGLLTMVAPPPAPLRTSVSLAYEVRLLSLQIRRQVDKKVVAAVELLSMVNKRPGPERRKYLKKREAYFEKGIHLIEIDLLRNYPRMPFDDELPACDYVIMVHDAYEGLACDVWPITVHQQLPIVPVPLLQPDPPARLDIRAALNVAYADARYDLRIDYSHPAEPPLSAKDASWAAELIVYQADREE